MKKQDHLTSMSCLAWVDFSLVYGRSPFGGFPLISWQSSLPLLQLQFVENRHGPAYREWRAATGPG